MCMSLRTPRPCVPLSGVAGPAVQGRAGSVALCLGVALCGTPHARRSRWATPHLHGSRWVCPFVSLSFHFHALALSSPLPWIRHRAPGEKQGVTRPGPCITENSPSSLENIQKCGFNFAFTLSYGEQKRPRPRSGRVSSAVWAWRVVRRGVC